MNKVALDALSNDFCNFRLITLAAERESIPFYESIGYQMVDEKKNRGRHKPFMFIDLKALAAYLGLEGPGAIQFSTRKRMERH